jgi:hypothetical protein
MGFQKGHKGHKPKGATSAKTEAWKKFQADFLGGHTERFNETLVRLAESDDPEDVALFVNTYTKMVQYFKPQMQRVQHTGDEKQPVVIKIPMQV